MILSLQEVYNKTRNTSTRLKEIGNIYELKTVIKKNANCILKRLGGETIMLRKIQDVKKQDGDLYIYSPNCIYKFNILGGIHE